MFWKYFCLGVALPLLLAILAGLLLLLAWPLWAPVVFDPRQTVDERDAQAEFGVTLPKQSELGNHVHLAHSQRIEGDWGGGNDYAFEFSASRDDIPRLKEGVLTYFQHEHHQDRDFKIDTSNARDVLTSYWGDRDYKPSWWTPASLPDPDVVLITERGVKWLYIFSKSRGAIFYELVSW
jgi:hypothetical protein